ncbi:MAG: hypothetical protein ACE5HC_11760 [Candidatus Binatia bacterium]
MEIVKATLWIYGMAFVRSTQLVGKNWAVSFAPLAYSVILSVAAFFLIPFGIIGGILLVLTGNACVSSGLYLIENILNAGKADLSDFTGGFTVYLWEVVRISFILWIPMRVAATVLSSAPNGLLFLFFIQIALYIILNGVPELIYQSRASGLDLLAGSYSFITENWIEWLTPNLLITLAGVILLRVLDWFVSGLPSSLQFFVTTLGLGLFLTYFMTFRGLLFAELNGTTPRGRVYRYRTRSSS